MRCACISLCAAVCLAACAADAAVKTYKMKRTSSPPKIDGRISDACWKRDAVELSDFRFLEGTGGGAGPVRTEARLTYDNMNLYVAVLCVETMMNNLVATETKHDGEVWRDDEVELFLNPSGDRRRYVQIAVNTRGVIMDASFTDAKKGMSLEYESGAEVAVHKGRREWSVELRIPFANLPVEEAGGAWTFHIARNRQAAGQLYTSLRTPIRAFHVPKDFDVLEGIELKSSGLTVSGLDMGELLQGTNVCKARIHNRTDKQVELIVSGGIEGRAGTQDLTVEAGAAADVEIPWVLAQGDRGKRFVLTITSGGKKVREQARRIADVPAVFSTLRPGAYYFSADAGVGYVLKPLMSARSRAEARIAWKAERADGTLAGKGSVAARDDPVVVPVKWSNMKEGVYAVTFELVQNGKAITSGKAELSLIRNDKMNEQIKGVWAVNDGEKVKRFDVRNANKFANSVWDRRQVSLFGARNEVVGFQVIVQSGKEGAAQVDASLAELTHADGTALKWKPEGQPGDYRGRQIERFTQHYLHIKKGSNPGWFYARTARPRDMEGWVPDALVPFNARKGRGGAPFDIGPEQNQGVWFDVYVPRDASPGDYRGVVKVTSKGAAVAELPVVLRAMDFTLPDENHFHSMICFSEGGARRRHGQGGDELLARYHRMAKRHRVEFTHTYRAGAGGLHADCISGKAFTPEHGYEGPGEGVGYSIIPASFYGINQSWQGDSAWGTADRFMNWLKKVKPDAITFLYITDEPPASRFPWIKSIGEHHHKNPGPGGKLPMFVTKAAHPGLEGAIDIWATVSNHVDLDKVKREKAKGRRWWYYNGQRPQAGTEITGAPAVDPRVGMWACWKYGIEVWFYWHANHWQHNHQYPRGDQNVWVDPVTFGGAGGVNGDGVIIYAGQDAFHRDQDRGLAGPVSSIRLKNIRRGMQDYEYLWLAAANGLGKEARAIADKCVPAAFSEARGDVSWSVKGSDWDEKRLRLAEGLEKKLKGN